MRPRLRTFIACGWLALAGCRAQTSQPASASPITPTTAAASFTEPDRVELVHRRPGVAHSAVIDKLAVSPDGAAAISRDASGGLRLWPALDGTREPIALPTRGASSFSLVRKGDGWTIFVVEGSGGAKLIDVDAQDQLRIAAEWPPFQPVFEGHLLPDAEHVLVLYRDHSVQLMDRERRTVARVDGRRFRPSQLRLSADGKRALAITDKREGSGHGMQLHAIDISLGAAPKLERAATAQQVTMANEPLPATLALAPDGRRVCYVERTNQAWELVIAELGSDGAPRRIPLNPAIQSMPMVGFVSAKEILVSPNDGAVTWLARVGEDGLRARTAPPQDFSTPLRAEAIAVGRHVTSFGTWLYTSEPLEGNHRYLGYRSLQAHSVAVSPDNEAIAVQSPQGPISVVSLKDEDAPLTMLTADPMFGTFKVRFVDPEHLVVLDAMGGLEVVHWRSGRTVAREGINGSPRSLEVDPANRLVLVHRHSSLFDARLFELDDRRQFVGPYIVTEAHQAGLLTRPEPGMWTLKGDKLRTHGLEALRADTAGDDAPASTLAAGVGLYAVDNRGRRYGMTAPDGQLSLVIDDNGTTRTRVLGRGGLHQIVPSPDGRHVLVVVQRETQVVTMVLDVASLEDRWSMSTGSLHADLGWSPDGRYVASTGNTGTIVADAATGDAALRRCGIGFEVRSAPPSPFAHNAVNERTLCEP